MLMLRFKRIGRKRAPFYRLIIIEQSKRREGRPVDEVGYYDPITKEFSFSSTKLVKWIKAGVKPTKTVLHLLERSNILTK